MKLLGFADTEIDIIVPQNQEFFILRINTFYKNEIRGIIALAITVGLRNVGFFGWKVSPPILLLSKEKCVAPKPTLLKPTAVSGQRKIHFPSCF